MKHNFDETVNIGGYDYNNAIAVAKRVAGGSPMELVVGGSVQDRRVVAALTKNIPFYIAHFGRPQTKDDWKQAIDFSVRNG